MTRKARRLAFAAILIALPLTAIADQDPLERLAPQHPVVTGVVDCGADDGTDYAEFTGAGTDADKLLIADGYTFTIANRTASSIASCVLVDSTEVAIGLQSGPTTRTDIDDAVDAPNGDGQGSMLVIAGFSSLTATSDFNQMRNQPGFRGGICEAESTLSARYGGENFGLYAPCIDNDECNGDGGTPASTECEEDPADIRALLSAKPGPKLIGQYLACRCTVAAQLDVTVWARARQN